MNTSSFVPTLLFATLGIVLVVIVVLLVTHMRKRSNRHPMEGVRERRGDEMERGVPPRPE